MQGRADVEAGICLHKTTACASTTDMRTVSFSMKTTCANVERLAELVTRGDGFDAYHEIDTRLESEILNAGRVARVCTDCVVPVSLLKALRVACGLAWPKEVSIALTQDEASNAV
jgi:hypothetical protein